MELKDIDKLAELSRIEIDQEEKEGLLGDMKAILGYIDQIQNVSISISSVVETEHDLRNVMREDVGAYNPGQYTEKILAEVPESENGFVKVQAIL